MGSGFCGRRITPLSFESRCSFIFVPSVHISAAILALSSLHCHLLSPQAPANASHRPCSLTLDLSPSPHLTPAGNLARSWELRDGGEMAGGCSLWFLLSLQHDCCSKMSLWTQGLMLPERAIFLKTCPRSRAKVLLISVPVCNSTAMQCQVLAQNWETVEEQGGTREIKGLGNKRQQV